MKIIKSKAFGGVIASVILTLFASPVFATSSDHKNHEHNKSSDKSLNSPLLGEAAEYNLFIKDDIFNYGDIDGKIAAGDDVVLRNGSIGSSLSNSDIAVYAGDDLNIYNVNIHDDIAYGDRLNSKYSSYNEIDNSQEAISFNSAFNNLTKLSSDLKKKTSTGVFDIERNRLTYSGTANDDIHYINLTQREFDRISDFTWDIAENESVIINVKGRYIVNNGKVTTPNNVLFNFYEAKNMKFTASFEGHILAPKAHIRLLCATITGQVIAKSWNGHGSLKQDTLFDPNNDDNPNPAVPIPVPAGLLLIGMAIMFCQRKALKK